MCVLFNVNVKRNIGLCSLHRCKAGKQTGEKLCKDKEKQKSDSSEKYNWGRVACKVARLTSSEPSLQKQVVSAK